MHTAKTKEHKSREGKAIGIATAHQHPMPQATLHQAHAGHAVAARLEQRNCIRKAKHIYRSCYAIDKRTKTGQTSKAEDRDGVLLPLADLAGVLSRDQLRHAVEDAVGAAVGAHPHRR
jgi:hypothetical protein